MRKVTEADLAAMKFAAEAMVRHCAEVGIVLTIEQVSDTKHPAMGNHKTEVSVRAVREYK